MRKLTLDETWFRCLRMWRWIGGQIKADPNKDVIGLKSEWLDEHDPNRPVRCSCYFCDYGQKHSHGNTKCFACPAKGGHMWCEEGNWSWKSDPLAFLAKLEPLFKTYKAQKRVAKGKKKSCQRKQ